MSRYYGGPALKYCITSGAEFQKVSPTDARQRPLPHVRLSIYEDGCSSSFSLRGMKCALWLAVPIIGCDQSPGVPTSVVFLECIWWLYMGLLYNSWSHGCVSECPISLNCNWCTPTNNYVRLRLHLPFLNLPQLNNRMGPRSLLVNCCARTALRHQPQSFAIEQSYNIMKPITCIRTTRHFEWLLCSGSAAPLLHFVSTSGPVLDCITARYGEPSESEYYL